MTLRADEALRSLISDTAGAAIEPATEDDWDAEYLELILAAKTVGSLDEAIDHINRHGSKHSDVIVTENPITAETIPGRRGQRLLLLECQHPVQRR